jgi:demethylmenaquinone methyltransferase/2-methoxy-6-polyprenyl-1,4-benzoquinol methylase
MFDEVAPRYDLVNDLAALGQDRRWRKDVVDALAPQSGELILDLAAGTGTSAEPIARHGAHVVCADLSLNMMAVGKKRHPSLQFVAGDAGSLPFADGVFDAATISFGLRNVPDVHQALTELFRVVRSNGTLVICEFSTPVNAPTRFAYKQWLRHGLPLISRLASSDTPAYSYLRESIFDWPDQRHLAQSMQEAGWTDIQWRNLTGGIVALHRATRP